MAKSVQKVVDNLYFIPGREGFLPDSNIYLIRTGDRFVLFDSGIPHLFKDTVGAVQKLGLKISQLDRLILTHTHVDHSGSAPLFMHEAKDMELWVSQEEGILLEKGDNTLVLGSLPGRRLPPLPVARKLKDGDVIRISDFSFQVLLTPGHSTGSLSFYEPNHRILISGDVVFRHGSFGRVDLPTGDGKQLIASIERLAELPVKILLPGHMGIATENGQDEIRLSLQFARQFL